MEENNKSSIAQMFSKLRDFLNDNKVFIEVFSFLVLGIAGVYVSYNSYRVSEVELKIHEAELTPVFKIGALDSLEAGRIFRRGGIKIARESGYAKNVICEVLTYVTLIKDSLVDGEHIRQRNIKLKMSYYANCENALGSKGFIACSIIDSLPYNGTLIEPDGAVYPVFMKDTGSYSYRMEEISIVHLTYKDILGETKELYYDVHRGGNLIAKEDVTLKYAKDCVNENDPNEGLNFTFDSLRAFLDAPK